MQSDGRASIQRALTYLQHTQRADGGFDSFSSPCARAFVPERTYRTIFTPALILGALAGIPEAAGICKPLAAWLLAQKSAAWSFNYWDMDAPERQSRPYPDDLDDTFCALIGLYRYDPKLVDAAALGSIVRLLLATESQVGGPYRTWLVPGTADAKWLDVDLAVNCNIAHFVQLVAHPLPNVADFIEQAVRSGAWRSPYYPHPYPLWYYAARAYRGAQAAALRARIRRHARQGHWGSPLRTALALSALRSLGDTRPHAAAMRYLLHQQQPDGSWPAEAFCADPAIGGKPYYSGAPALTTALVLEALQSYLPQISGVSPKPAAAAADTTAAALYHEVVMHAKKEAAELPGAALRTALTTTLQQMVRGDRNQEVVLLPLFFARSLAADVPHPPASLLTRLGLANLYGWTAYTIYDDFLDAEGDARLLPVASTALRLSVHHFLAAGASHPEYQQFVQETMHRIDAANSWEVTHCRFAVLGERITIGLLPRFIGRVQLAERSWGHVLPVIGVLAHLGVAPADPRARQLLTALKHYLIARQLGDDIRDWQDDLRAGLCTYVVASLLTGAAVQPGSHPLPDVLSQLQQEFTAHGLSALSMLIRRHARQAQQALRRSTLIAPGTPIDRLITDLDRIAERQLTEHAEAQRFLHSYRGA